MKNSLLVVGAILLLTATACSSPQPAPVQSAAASGPDLCETSTAESIDLLNAALDRIDRASSSAEIEEASISLPELFEQAGANVGQHCKGERVGASVSELIVWASSAATTRPSSSAGFAEGFLKSVCGIDDELGIEFTPAAQVACA